MLQGPHLVMTALGVEGSAERWLGPPLEAGIHLRWAFTPALGFPARGFTLYRRPHAPGTLVDVPIEGRPTVIRLPAVARRIEAELTGGDPFPRGRPGRPPRLVGSFRDVPVAESRLRTSARRVLLSLASDAIDAVTLEAGRQWRLRRLRHVPVGPDETAGWRQLAAICLPLTGPAYPCHAGPENPTLDWQAAVGRIGPAGGGYETVVDRYVGAQASSGEWQRLHEILRGLWNPPIPASLPIPFTAEPEDPLDDEAPGGALTPVDLLLVASVDPWVARVLGLAWLDATAAAGQRYDYKLAGNWLKTQIKAPTLTIDFEADPVGRRLPHTFLRDGVIVRTANRGTVDAVPGTPWADTRHGLDVGSFGGGFGPYLRLQLQEPVAEVQLYLRVVQGQPRLGGAGSTSRWTSADGRFTILTLAATAETEPIEFVTVEPAAGSGELRVTLCKVGLLPAWSPPMGESMAWMCYDVRAAPPAALPAPAGLVVEPLPTPTRELPNGGVASGPRAGLGWTIPLAGDALLPGQPVRYVLQRQSLGSGAVPAAFGSGWDTIRQLDHPDTVVTVAATDSDAPHLFVDDPAWALGLAEAARFYAYRVAAVDLFGRLGAWSAAVVADLHDVDAPPPPLAVEARYLDPRDPALTLDDRAWVDEMTPPQAGIAVRWRWPETPSRRQAPDAREFRVYAQRGRLNTLTGRVTAVSALGDDHFVVTTDQTLLGAAAGVFQGEWLLCGGVFFTVIDSTPGAQLQLTVRRPAAPPPARPALGPFTVSIRPPRPLEGTVTGAVPHLDGTVTLKTDVTSPLPANGLVGKWLSQGGRTFRIIASSGPPLRLVVLGRGRPSRVPGRGAFTVVEMQAGGFVPVPADPGNPLWVDYRRPEAWAERVEVIPVTAGSEYLTRIRLPLEPSAEDPVVYAQVGISAADDKDYAADHPRWDGTPLGGRPGNEGLVCAPALVQRALRQEPPRPEAPDVGDGVATAADYHGRSWIDIRWQRPEGVRVEVYRALDEAIFAADRAARSARSTDRADYPRLSDAEYEALVLSVPDYGDLPDPLLGPLAGLPGNDAAFGMITAAPVEGDGYLAAIDSGRATNRHCFALRLIDAAGNRSVLGWPSRAVRTPKTLAPRAPVITRVLGGDRAITLRWAANREPDLAEYRVYRTEGEETAADMRRMALAGVVPGNAAAPAEITFVDGPVPGLVSFFYRVAAVDQSGNVGASLAVTARAHDETLPVPPVPEVAWAAGGAEVRWSGADESLLQHRVPVEGQWYSLTAWLPPGDQSYLHDAADRSSAQEYRLWARRPTGTVAIGAPVRLDPV